MEGTADAVASSVKLGSGWLGDRLGHRKAIVTVGYLMTGVAGAFYALADVRGVVVLVRIVAWLGKGIRGPLRDAILADAVSPANRGKVFGFHRAGDTVGAVLGPLTAALLLWMFPVPADGDPAQPFRLIFLLTLVPGIGAALAFMIMIREEGQAPRMGRFWASVQALPTEFRRALVGIGVFGAGDFAAALLVLAATWLLSLSPDHQADAWALGAALYTLRNVLYALASYPVGALSDRVNRRNLLACGYVLGSLVIAGFSVLLWMQMSNLPLLAVLFALAGVFAAFEDSLKGAITADLVPDKTIRGTAYGVMGTVSGLGDLVSSVGVGALWWAFGPVHGFLAAAGLMLAGAILLVLVRGERGSPLAA
jgi:MFS family permease